MEKNKKYKLTWKENGVINERVIEAKRESAARRKAERILYGRDFDEPLLILLDDE